MTPGTLEAAVQAIAEWGGVSSDASLLELRAIIDQHCVAREDYERERTDWATIALADGQKLLAFREATHVLVKAYRANPHADRYPVSPQMADTIARAYDESTVHDYSDLAAQRAKLALADEIVSLIECRIDDTRTSAGRMAMTPFSRDRMEALEAAVAAYRGLSRVDKAKPSDTVSPS